MRVGAMQGRPARVAAAAGDGYADGSHRQADECALEVRKVLWLCRRKSRRSGDNLQD